MPLWLLAEPLVLASKSEVRQRMLAAAGLRVETRPADLDERALERDLGDASAADIAMRLAAEKAKIVAASMPTHIVVGADQVLVLDGMRFSKPADHVAAREQLRALRGKMHMLCSAVAVAHEGAIRFRHTDTARLTMRDFSDQFIENYLDVLGADATASVGAYQLEKAGVHLFDRIEGDYFTILGLPLMPLLQFFRRAGFVSG